jgi:broad specificity phosphatase PhoE
MMLGLRGAAEKNFVNITFFAHSTSVDDERKVASGWNDPQLSELGKKQALSLNAVVKHRDYEVVYCSDLKRAAQTADIAFDIVAPVVTDKRLRECNYGDLNGKDMMRVSPFLLSRIERPYPNGESYRDVEKRVKAFLEDIARKHAGQSIAVISHQGPQLALEVLLKNANWERSIRDDWRSKSPAQWKAGWEYILKI